MDMYGSSYVDKNGVKSLPLDGVVCVVAGIVLEITVVLKHFITTNYVFNAVFGLVATIILWYGVMRILMRLGVKQTAIPWVLCAGLLFLMYRVVNIVDTVSRHYFATLVGVSFDLDMLLKNVFLVSSGMVILVGVLRALHASQKAQKLLIERNEALDREIAERTQSELRVRTSEATLSVFINALCDAAFLVDKQGRIVVHNERFAGLFGQGDPSLCGKLLRDVMPPPLYETGFAHVPQVLEAGVSQHFIASFSGHTYEVKEYPVTDTGGSISSVVVLAQDITERLQTDRSRRLLETAIGCAAESIMITDKAGCIEYVNAAFEQMTGYTSAEALGRTPALLRSGHHAAEFYTLLWQTISNGEVWCGEFLNRHKDGTQYRERATISPIIDEDGVITHYVAVKRNVTRERELERQVQQAQKIEILGTLAGGIAHDFNNVLSIIMGHGELVAARIAPDHPVRKNLDTIIKTAAGSSKLTKRLLAFSRQGAGEAEPLHMPSLVQEQIKILRVYLPAHIKISEWIDPNAGYINSEASEVQQAIMNLCTNASHAMHPAGGNLEICLGLVEVSTRRTAAAGDLEPGRYVQLRLRDTGCGMDEETLQCIFDPFFTTKASEAGTGLGLAMVHGSVTRFAGAIDVSSRFGQGTQFDLYWPSLDYIPTQKKTREAAVAGNGRHILIVDDMEDFSALTQLNLINHGFEVSAFSDPFKAVAFFKDNAARVGAAVVDYMMPEMNGHDLSHALHQIRPDLPVVLLTGYSCGITPENAHKNGFDAILYKPSTSDKLAACLVELIPQERLPSDFAPVS